MRFSYVSHNYRTKRYNLKYKKKKVLSIKTVVFYNVTCLMWYTATKRFGGTYCYHRQG
jgi:hypothetical protein